jgi:hypothetical protein
MLLSCATVFVNRKVCILDSELLIYKLIETVTRIKGMII